MNHTSGIVVTFFNSTHDLRWNRLLFHWIATYRASGSTVPLFVLTDEFTQLPELPPDITSIIAPPLAVAVFRDICRERGEKGYAFDYKAVLICAALAFKKLPRSCLIVDVDATIHAPVEPLFETLQREGIRFAMPPDPGARKIFVRGALFTEHSSCTLYFGDTLTDGVRIADNYRCAWLDLAREHMEQEGLRCDLREQRSWSVAWARLRGPLLSRQHAWSPRCWGEPPPDVAIIHRHGDQKWNHQGESCHHV